MTLRADEPAWVPHRLRGTARQNGPASGAAGKAPPDRRVRVNTVRGEVEAAPDEEMLAEMERYGVVKEPEIGRDLYGRLEGAYSDVYWTHFDWRPDVARAVVRVQKRVPWKTYANTYRCHPPAYNCGTTEYYSVDYWGGGLKDGRYVGYRGKDISRVVNGWEVFDVLWDDPHPPDIWWIIYGGYQWVRGYGWGPAPWGPPDSDPGHHAHIHVTFV